MDTNKIIELFYSKIPITTLEKELKIDQRKIRKIWRDTFGTSKRKIKENNKRHLSQEKINDIKKLVLLGLSNCEISKELNISLNTVINNMKYFPELKEKLKNNNIRKNKEFLTSLRSKFKLTIEQKDIVSKYFESNLFSYEIAKIVGISMSSVRNIFKEIFGIEKYKQRVKRLEVIRIKKAFDSLEKAGKCGSKPENKFYDILCDSLNIYIKHHDFDIFPPFEIDITIPELKIAICWDGIGHFKPIFGEKMFKKVCYRDKQKKKKLTNDGWIVINIKDIVSNPKMDFFLKQKEYVLDIIKSIGRGDIIK